MPDLAPMPPAPPVADAALIALAGGREDRLRAVTSALAVLGADPRWSAPEGVLRLEVLLPDTTVEVWSARFGARGAELDDDAEPDVVVRVPLVPLVRLVTGQADGALLYLSGTVEVTGSEDFLLALGSAITLGGRAVIDAAALDPVAVSRAIADVRTEHLAAVMAGGFRDLVLSEVFGRFPEFVIAEKAARVQVAIAFEIGGRSDGGVDRYVVRLEGGGCEVIAGATPDTPVDATLELEGHEFLRLVLGHLNPVRGVLGGQVRVRGQVVKALGFNAVMRIPGS